jgi:hypothetical protein
MRPAEYGFPRKHLLGSLVNSRYYAFPKAIVQTVDEIGCLATTVGGMYSRLLSSGPGSVGVGYLPPFREDPRAFPCWEQRYLGVSVSEKASSRQ